MSCGYSRVFYKALISVIVCFLFGLVIAERSFAAIDQVERPEEELLILEVYVNETLRNKGFIAYMPEESALDRVMIPLSSFSRALSFAIRSNPTEGTADGWFNEENNIFQLDLNRNIVFVNGREHNIPIGGAEAHFEDIYVQSALLEEWLGVKVRVDLSTLRIFVTWGNLFPFEEEEARKKRGKYLRVGSVSESLYDKDTLIPYDWWTNPSIVWQHSVVGRGGDTGKNINTDFSLQATADALKSSAKLLISGSAGTDKDPKFSNAQLSFQKRDPTQSLLGPLKAGKVSFGDVSFPDVPLIVGRKRGRGVAVTSDSELGFAQSFGSETYTVDGDAPIGWDAELYRNGYFIAFQEIDGGGRYNFEDVNLTRGFNLFQIVLSGPEGQKRTQTQRIIRGPKMLQKDDLRYAFAVGQPEADLIPIADNSDANSDFGGSAQISYGVRNYLTVGANVYTGEDSASNLNTRQTSAGVSAVVAFLGLKTKVQLMGANEGRSGYDVEATTRIMGANITAGHTAYQGFDADDKDLLSTTTMDVNKNFKSVSASIRAEKNKFQDKEDELVLTGSLSTNLSGVRLTNVLERTISDRESQEDFEGNLALLTNVLGWRVRSNLRYDLQSDTQDTLRNFNMSAIKTLTPESSIRLNGLYDFSSDSTTMDMRYSKQFENYSIDLNAGADTNNSYFGGITFRTGLQPDHNGKYKMVSARDSGLGSVGLRTYLDSNGNRAYDEGEKPIKNITFRSNRGVIDGHTDENGSLFVNGLTEGITRLWLDNSSLPSIYMKPHDDYVTIIPRSGAMASLDIGFEQLGEVDGFIYAKNGDGSNKPLPGMEILLLNAQTGEEVTASSSEYDGYYVFSALSLGDYIVKAIPFWDGDATSVEVSVTGEKPIVTDITIMIKDVVDDGQDLAMNDNGVNQIEPTSGDHKVDNVVDDAPVPVVTDGLDVASGEVLRGLFVHVGSLSTFEDAKTAQKGLWTKYPDVLGDTPIYIYRIEVGGVTYHRIIGAITSYSSGNRICDVLIAKNEVGGCSLVEL